MKVFKFGGASIKDVEGIKNVANIIKKYRTSQLIVVISASGKITNALEEVVNSYTKGHEDLNTKWQYVKDYHLALLHGLLGEDPSLDDLLSDLFAEVEWVLEEPPARAYDYVYDQIVSIGELLSTRIVSNYLNRENITNKWVDARDIIITDETYREGKIQWEETLKKTNELITPIIKEGIVCVTQGFIGATKDNETTTLGREGSDYSAAILSHCLHGEAMVIWKDVSGVLTADPRLFDNVQKLDKLSYQEAIEMTYYGATVIHPKTIKPIQNKSIPLYVKSFLDPDAEGTIISSFSDLNYPPVVMVEKNQILLKITTRDFSFVVESHLAMIFDLFAKYRIKINMMRNSAISFSVSVNNDPGKIDSLCAELEANFNISRQDGFQVYTVRHFTDQMIEHLKENKLIGMEDRTDKTLQMAVKDIPLMTLKH
jgi:aspartate kinase